MFSRCILMIMWGKTFNPNFAKTFILENSCVHMTQHSLFCWTWRRWSGCKSLVTHTLSCDRWKWAKYSACMLISIPYSEKLKPLELAWLHVNAKIWVQHPTLQYQCCNSRKFSPLKDSCCTMIHSGVWICAPINEMLHSPGQGGDLTMRGSKHSTPGTKTFG